MPKSGWGDRLKDLGQDLINIEVNTILTDGMTGRKMPPFPEALYDIAKLYDRFLRQDAGLDVDTYIRGSKARSQPDGTPTPPPDGSDIPAPGDDDGIAEAVTNGVVMFRALRWTALVAINRHIAASAAQQTDGGGHQTHAEPEISPPVDENDFLVPEILTIVQRIQRNSGQLELLVGSFAQRDKQTTLIGVNGRTLYKGLSKRQDALPVVPAVDLTRVRKIWEIGIDTIVLQSVLQLDGDIVFRADKNLDLNTRAALVDAHRQFVDLGVTHWRAMFELLASLMGSLLGRLLPGR